MSFIVLNPNPKKKKTGDCVIRSLSIALNKDYWQIVEDLINVYKKTGYIINSKECFQKYLKNLGYEMQKMPRRENNTRYSVFTFLDEIAQPNTTYIISLANHLTVIKDKTVYDLWDCRHKFVGNYWIIK